MRNVGAIFATLALILAAAPAGAVDTTSIAVSSVTVGATAVTVGGVLTLGDDALAPVTVSTDPQNDSRPNAAGLDIGDSTMTVDYSGSSPKLVVQQKTFGSVADADGNPPALGYGWPIQVSGYTGDPLWLGAGSRGTNFTPRDKWWTGVCSAGADGWICASDIEGSVNAEGVTWKVPFTLLNARVGRTVAGSEAFGARPASFVWPSVVVTMPTAPSDTATNAVDYLIPGLVEAGIAPVGVPEWEVSFVANPSNNNAAFNPRTGAYSMNVPKPATTGDHTLWVRTCFGDPEAPTCSVTQQLVTL